MTKYVLELRDATKEFHGIPAIKGVNFSLAKGEVHALLGENGAGKSTLTKVFSGVHQLTSGQIYLDGEPTKIGSPSDARSRGIAMVFQETNLVPSMTVAQNLFLGEERLFNRLRGLYIEAQQFLQGLNFDVDPTALVSSLGAAKKQMVEIARAVRNEARVIIFDEPTATLTPEEKHHFFLLVERLRSSGVAIIFISHALEEALTISSTITVLRDGSVVSTGSTKEYNRSRIVSEMVGRTLKDDGSKEGASGVKRQVRKRGPKVLSVQNLSQGTMVRNTSLSVYGGQVTGLFGLVGAGRSETFKVVAGVTKRNTFGGGEIIFEGKPVRFRIPRQAVLSGIAYITEDRRVDGFFEGMSIDKNIAFAEITMGSNPFKWASRKLADAVAMPWRKAMKIRSIDGDAKVIALSGGNQQKVVIAKSLIQKPRLVIFDEPTRGVDVGAIEEIHQIINGLADEGVAVVVISSYLPEVLKLSDRILIARQGRIVEEMLVNEADEKSIMFAAIH